VITDIHTHVIPQSYVETIGREIPTLRPEIFDEDGQWFVRYPFSSGRSFVPRGFFDADARVQDMDDRGIDIHLLAVPPMILNYGLANPDQAADAATIVNEAMIAMARTHPDRFKVLAHLPLQSPALTLAELDRLRGVPEIAGVQVGTNVNGLRLDDVSLVEMWNVLDAAGLPVVLHPHDVVGLERMEHYHLHNLVGNPAESTLAAGTLMFGGVMTRNPNLRVAVLHGGGFLPYQIGRFEQGWTSREWMHEHLDVSPREILDRFYFDSLTHDEMSLRFLVERVGSRRVCLGSDYPYDMGVDDPAAAARDAIKDESQLSDVLSGSAADFLGLQRA
jgi:aminocarboxymuconate-semialdehyde decarboxylase